MKIRKVIESGDNVVTLEAEAETPEQCRQLLAVGGELPDECPGGEGCRYDEAKRGLDNAMADLGNAMQKIGRMESMCLWEIRTGRIGESYERMYAWAASHTEAVKMAERVYMVANPGRVFSRDWFVGWLFSGKSEPFCTEPSSDGFAIREASDNGVQEINVVAPGGSVTLRKQS